MLSLGRGAGKDHGACSGASSCMDTPKESSSKWAGDVFWPALLIYRRMYATIILYGAADRVFF